MRPAPPMRPGAPRLFALLALALALLCGAPGALAQESLVPDAILYPGDRPGIILVVDMARQELRVYRHDGQGGVFLEKTIPCSTGMARGDKLVRGDKKTPVGYYIFNQKLLPRELPDIYGVLAYPMDYPNFWDRRVGRGGDGIWTHGVNKPLVDFDSEGCVELFNHDIAALEEYISLYETPILIYESLGLAEASDLAAEAGGVLAFLDEWRGAWAGKRMDAYRAMYSPTEFTNSDGLPYEAWMRHKAEVANAYRKIEIGLEDVKVFRHRDVIVASFAQLYQGDRRYRSKGLKRLYLRPKGRTYEIVGEEFHGGPPPIPDKWLRPEERLAALTTPPIPVSDSAVPVAIASAGAILPGGSLPGAELPVLSAGGLDIRDEGARAAIEARSRGAVPQGQPSPDDSPAEPALSAPPAGQGLTASLAAAAVPPKFSSEDRVAPPQGGPRVIPQLVPRAQPAGQVAGGTVPGPGLLRVEGSAGPKGPGAPGSGTVRVPVEGALRAGLAPPPAPPGGPAPGPEGAPAAADPEAELLSFLASWEDSWERKDAQAFFGHYAEGFYFPDRGMRLSAFKDYRGGLIRKAGSIEVAVSDPKVSLDGRTATLTFTQSYRSGGFQDKGTKTLTLAREPGEDGGPGPWKITRETFRAAS